MAHTITRNGSQVEHVDTPGAFGHPLCGAENRNGEPWRMSTDTAPGAHRKPRCSGCKRIVSDLTRL